MQEVDYTSSRLRYSIQTSVHSEDAVTMYEAAAIMEMPFKYTKGHSMNC